VDSGVDEGSMASSSTEGVYMPHPFTAPPRPPTDLEVELNECSNYVWPDLYFEKLGNCPYEG
jgi:hypothetical protein